MSNSITLLVCFLAILNALLSQTGRASIVFGESAKAEVNQNDGDSTPDARVLIIKRQVEDYAKMNIADDPDSTLILVTTPVSVSPANPTLSVDRTATTTSRQQSTTQSADRMLQSSHSPSPQTTAPEQEIIVPKRGKGDAVYDVFDELPTEDPGTSIVYQTFTTPSDKVTYTTTTHKMTNESPKASSDKAFATNSTNGLTTTEAPIRHTTKLNSESSIGQTTRRTITIPSFESTTSSAMTETETNDPFGDFDEAPVKQSTPPTQRPPSGSGSGRSAGGGRAASGSLPTKLPTQPTTEIPSSSSSTVTDRPSEVVRSDNYGGILDPSSRFEKISLEEALVRGRTAAVAAGLGTEPEMFTWLIMLLLLLLSTVAWIWFCCVK